VRVAVGDDLVQVELELKQQLSAPLPADTAEYESTQLLARPAVAAAGAISADANAVVNTVRSMGSIVATGGDTGGMMDGIDLGSSSSASSSSRKRERLDASAAPANKRAATGSAVSAGLNLNATNGESVWMCSRDRHVPGSLK